MSQQFHDSPKLEIHLRNVTERDLPILFTHQREPEANEMAAFPARDRDAFMIHWAKSLADETVLAMTILVGEDVAGNIVGWGQDGRRLVGYWLGREYWGRGVATNALGKYLQVHPPRPLHAYVAKHNVASIRVLEKCGFTSSLKETHALGEPADGIEQIVYKLDASYNPTS